MAEKIVLPKAFTKEWYEYVWDYYKWHIIVGIAVVALSVFTYFEITTSIKYDTNINFVASGVIPTEMADEIAAKCAENSADLNGNDRVDISFTQVNFTEENRNDSEMNYALTNKLMTLFVSQDELLFITDSYMLEQLSNMSDAYDVFYDSSEWAPDNSVSEGKYAISLANSSVLKEIGIDSSDMYVLIARTDYEEGMKPEEENAIKIAHFLIK